MSAKQLHGTDTAFLDAGKKAGIEIWRIESLKPVKVPEKQYGKFYEGDSYIILHTQQKTECLNL